MQDAGRCQRPSGLTPGCSRLAVVMCINWLYTYDVRQVLKEEVHYTPNNRVLGGLRHGKKYAVPESPLLQVGAGRGGR